MLTLTLSEEVEYEHLGVKVTPVGLIFREDLPKEIWIQIGNRLNRTEAVIKWYVGDWAAFGERKYGDLTEFAKLHDIKVQNLKNWAWVSRSVEKSRRRDDLEWSFHSEVASLNPPDQSKWLARASQENLSISDFREEIRVSKGEFNALDSEGRSIKLGTKHYDDLLDWLQKRTEAFWTKDRKEIWTKRVKALADAIP